jgi:hypothetical protein
MKSLTFFSASSSIVVDKIIKNRAGEQSGLQAFSSLQALLDSEAERER